MWMLLPVGLQQRWVDRHCIMEVEAMPVVTAVFAEPELFQGRDAFWFIDNVAALSAFVKGGSDAVGVDRAAAVVSLAFAHLQARCWFEHVQSESIWADGISRQLQDDSWVAEQHFAVRQARVPV